MIDLLKKTVFTGVGLAALTKEKTEELAASFKENFKLSQEEGEKLADELIQKSEESKEHLESLIAKSIDTAMSKANLAKQSDLDALRQEVETLKAELEALNSNSSD